MTPAPRSSAREEALAAGRWLADAPQGEEVCISGLAGTLPASDNVYHFQENLFNKVDMVTDNHERWPKSYHSRLPAGMGRIYNEEKFDGSFFGYHLRHSHLLDAMIRMLMEKTFEAIVDAGVNPVELRGSRTAVIVGACASEKLTEVVRDTTTPSEHTFYSGSRASYAQRISHWLRVNGPSYTVDTACSSSLYALEHGFRAIRDGLCDQAVVVGGNLAIFPEASLQFASLGVLSKDGRCKTFDDSANGYVRSESMNAVFLQKARDARRIYATVVYGKINCDAFKPEGITFPSVEAQMKLLEEFYEECDVDPAELGWVEAHGTATMVGDPVELTAIGTVLCANRKTPLPIGSVKSNIGHTEPASGLSSVTKVVIAMETGLIPPNLHYSTPKRGMTMLTDGTLQVVTEALPWNGGLVGINSFGFGGANCHILLKSHSKKKINGGAAEDKLPRLVAVSSRSEQGVDQMLDELTNRPVDTELVRLYQQVHCTDIPAHNYRGFVLLQPGKAIRHIQYYEPSSASVWFVFSETDINLSDAMNSLLALPTFAEAIERCQKPLSLYNIDLLKIAKEKSTLSINRSVITTAVQIGLLEVLKAVGITVDGVVGNSIGETVAAYADNCLTLDQAMLTAYYQGKAIQDRNKSNLLQNLQKVIPAPRARSSRWLTSGEQASYLGELASPEFFAERIFNAAPLRAALEKVPRNAILIDVSAQEESQEVATGIGRKINYVCLTENSTDQIESLLVSLGKMYLLGLTMDLAKLYPAVSYPVSSGTRMISPFVGWDHRRNWQVLIPGSNSQSVSYEMQTTIRQENVEIDYIRGHVIDGRNLFPATGYLVLVWQQYLSALNGFLTDVGNYPIVMEGIRFLRATNFSKDKDLEFSVVIQKVSGKFEVIEGGVAVVTGRIYQPKDISKEMLGFQLPITAEKGRITMLTKDVYKEFNLRGYNYRNLFRGIISADSKGACGKVRWANNWTTFLDNMLQLQILAEDTRGLFVPTSIGRILIDPKKHLAMVAKMKSTNNESVFDVVFNNDAKVIKSGGVEFHGLHASPLSRRKPPSEPVLEKYQFVPHKTGSLTLEEALRVCVHTALENHQELEIKTFELADEESDPNRPLLAPSMLSILRDLPLLRPVITVLAKPDHPLVLELGEDITVKDSSLFSESSCQFVVGSGLAGRPRLLQSASVNVGATGCIISREPLGQPLPALPGMVVVSDYDVEGERIVCLKKESSAVNPLVINLSEENHQWISQLQAAITKKSPERILIVSQGEFVSSILGFVNCLHKEPSSSNVRCFFIIDSNAPKFDPALGLYKNEIAKDLLMNVYKDGSWGAYRHLQLEEGVQIEAEHAFVNSLNRGDLSSLTWIKGPLKTGDITLKPNEELVYTYFSALNFRDVMFSTGKLSAELSSKDRLNQQCLLGFEFSGRNPTGRRVMGLVGTMAMSSMIVADSGLTWDIPDAWTMEDAATVPVVYATALYALYTIGRMARGDSVLVHAGSGGVGQAAINLALHEGCTVYTTVGTKEKRDFIKQRFPQLTDRQIGNSRDTSFEQLVMSETNGRGVDLVLNSLSEEKLQASVRCLAVGGRFLEIGKFDLAANNTLGMEIFLKETSFHGIMLDTLFTGTTEEKRHIIDIVQKGIDSGAVQPLTRKVFADDDVEQAFRYMAAGKHIGKVLLKIRQEEIQKIVIPEILHKKVAPRFVCRSKYTYVIAGGLGGFGLELADWMVLRGARKLVLTSRHGLKTGYQAARIEAWRSYGAQVVVSTADIATQLGVTTLLKDANAMGPVGGIFNLAVVLADALFENQTSESFRKSARPKSDATHLLDTISRQLCPALEHFVVFSSVSCGRGNAGQTNYGASNSVMERICERRVAQGLPGLAIQWGAVGDVGLVAEMQEDNYELVIGGTLQQRISSCLHVLEKFLVQPHPVVASMVVAEKRVRLGQPGNVVDSVCCILGIHDLKSISQQTSLAELGMDSIMAVEIKQMLERDYEIFLPPQEMRNLTLTKLLELSSKVEETKNKSNPASDKGIFVDAFNFMLRAVGNEEAASKPTAVLSSILNVEDKDPKTIFLIPGIEGMASVLEPLASNLNSQAVGLQLGYQSDRDSPLESTVDMARALLPHVKKSLRSEIPFHLLGYSFGGVVALDLAFLLEQDGFHGEVFLVDGSPDFVQTICMSMLVDGSDNHLQVNTLLAILNLIQKQTVIEVEKLHQELLTLNSWEERLEHFLKIAPETGISPEFAKAQANATIGRIRSVINYSWAHPAKIQSKVTLMRQTFPSIPVLEDYGVSKYCDKKVDVHLLEGDHVSILQSLQMASIINEQVMNVARGR